jgi:hypothetical protein
MAGNIALCRNKCELNSETGKSQKENLLNLKIKKISRKEKTEKKRGQVKMLKTIHY